MMAGLLDLTLAQARDAIRKGDTSPRDLTEAYIAAVEAALPLNAFITETPDKALAMADAAADRLAMGDGGEGNPCLRG